MDRKSRYWLWLFSWLSFLTCWAFSVIVICHFFSVVTALVYAIVSGITLCSIANFEGEFVRAELEEEECVE